MKKLTARNETEKEKKRGPDEMRSVPLGGANKASGAGPRFKKIGGGPPAAGGDRFKKVGGSVPDAGKSEEAIKAADEEKKEADKKAAEETEVERLRKEKEDLQKKFDELKAEHEMAKKGTESPVPPPAVAEKDISVEANKDGDVIMGENDDEEEITWEEYDFTKPTGCDHATCAGCKTDGIWDNDFEPEPMTA